MLQFLIREEGLPGLSDRSFDRGQPGVTGVTEEDGALVVATGSGVYQFESTRTKD